MIISWPEVYLLSVLTAFITKARELQETTVRDHNAMMIPDVICVTIRVGKGTLCEPAFRSTHNAEGLPFFPRN